MNRRARVGRRRGSMARDDAGHRARVRRHTSTTRGDSDGEGRCERCEWCRRRRSREAWDDGGGRAREGRRGRARGRCSGGDEDDGDATRARGRRARGVATRGKSDAGAGLPDGVDELMRKYAGDAATSMGRAAANAARTTTRASTRIGRGARTSYDGVFALLFLNLRCSRAITGGT